MSVTVLSNVGPTLHEWHHALLLARHVHVTSVIVLYLILVVFLCYALVNLADDDYVILWTIETALGLR